MPRDAQGNVIPGSYGPGGPPPGQPAPGGPPQPGMPPPDMPPEEPPPEEPGQDMPTDPLSGGLQQASPEEQAEADRTVGRAMELIYADNMFPQIVKMLEGGADDTQEGDPGRGLAMATEMVVARVANAADKAGHQIPPDVLFHAAGDILEELAEVSRRGRIKDYSQDPDALEAAWFQALDMFRERLANVGEISQESARADMDRLIRADQDGTLEKIMRSLADNDRSGQAGGQESPPEERGKERKPKGFNAAMGI